MTYQQRRWIDGVRSPIVLGLLALVLIFGGASPAVADSGSGSGGSGSSGSGSGGNRTFTLGEDSTNPGFLVRGGLSTCPASFNCSPNPSHEPRFHSCGFWNCGYNTAFVVVTALNGFSGTVTLDFPDLPAGVTSQTATSVTLSKDSTAFLDLKLQASTSAALGDFVITERGTSGSLVDTKTHVIRIVDELPPPATI